MPGTPSGSYASQLAIDTVNPCTKMFDFQTAGLVNEEKLTEPTGMSGTRSKHGERVRSSLQHIGGPIEMEPNALELSLLLPWVLGAVASGNTFALAETLTTRFVTIDRVAKVFTYSGCAIDTCKFSASQGEPLKLSLGVVGQTEAIANAGTFPAIAEDLTTQPFILSDLVCTIGGTTVQMKSMDVTISNHVDKERFFNSNTLSGILANDRDVTFETQLPYDTVLYAIYGSGGAGAAIVATFTNAATSLVFTMPAVFFPRKTPSVPHRAEIMLDIRGTAYMSSTNREIVCTLDSIP